MKFEKWKSEIFDSFEQKFFFICILMRKKKRFICRAFRLFVLFYLHYIMFFFCLFVCLFSFAEKCIQIERYRYELRMMGKWITLLTFIILFCLVFFFHFLFFTNVATATRLNEWFLWVRDQWHISFFFLSMIQFYLTFICYPIKKSFKFYLF